MKDRRLTIRWVGAFLLAFLALVVMGGGAQGATYAQPLPGVEVIVEARVTYTQTVAVPQPPANAPIDTELLSKGGFFTPALAVDAAGSTFLAYIRNDGGSAHGKLQRRNTQGVVTGNWELRVGQINGIQHKADGVSLIVTADDILAALSSHATNEGPRIMAIWEARVENVAAPYSQGQRPTGAEGANLGGVQEVPSNCATLPEISVLIDQKNAVLLQAIRNEFGGNIRQGIEDKTRDAVKELNLWSPSVQERGIDQWARDRHYEVLRDQRLLPTPTPPR